MGTFASAGKSGRIATNFSVTSSPVACGVKLIANIASRWSWPRIASAKRSALVRIRHHESSQGGQTSRSHLLVQCRKYLLSLLPFTCPDKFIGTVDDREVDVGGQLLIGLVFCADQRLHRLHASKFSQARIAAAATSGFFGLNQVNTVISQRFVMTRDQ